MLEHEVYKTWEPIPSESDVRLLSPWRRHREKVEARCWCGDPFLTLFVISTTTRGHLEEERVYLAYGSQTIMEGCQYRKSSRSSNQKPWRITAGWLPLPGFSLFLQPRTPCPDNSAAHSGLCLCSINRQTVGRPTGSAGLGDSSVDDLRLYSL